VLAALVDIAAQHRGGDVLVVSHGGVIRAVRRALDSADPHMPNLSGSWFSVDASGRVSAGEVVELVTSLAGNDPPRPGTPPPSESSQEVL
jgi:broad specificity phosphatase PhoE